MKKYTLLLLMVLAIVVNGYAQQIVKGTVFSSDNKFPIPGALVKILESKQAVTDSLGRFDLHFNKNGKYKISIKALGYNTMELSVNIPYDSQLIISMVPLPTQLEEVSIKTGYQEIAKERLTGSIFQVDNKLLTRSVSTGILDRLQDVVPGLIFNRSGVPFGSTGISVRGQSTIYANIEPLIVIDNFPYDGNINTINPNDVEDIYILKDAAAASIWGARAGNGVIVITTKKGKFNQPAKISFNTNFTLGNKPDLFYRKIMSSADYIETEKKLFNQGYYSNIENSNAQLPLSPVVELLIAKRDGKIIGSEADAQIESMKLYDVRRDIDKYMYQKSAFQQYTLNVQGGSENHTYYLSGGYDSNDQNLRGNRYDRYTLDITNTYSFLKKKLSVTGKIYYSETRSEQNNYGPSSIQFSSQGTLYPYARLVDNDGNHLPIANNYRIKFMQEASSKGLLDWVYKPLDEIDLADNTSSSKDYRIDLNARYRFFDFLNAEVYYQFNNINAAGNTFYSQSTWYTRNQINRLSIVNDDGSITRPVPMGGILDRSNSLLNNHQFRGQFNFNKSWQTRHQITALLGYEVKDLRTFNYNQRLYGYDDEHLTSQIVDYAGNYTLYADPYSTTNKIPNEDRQLGLTDRFVSVYSNIAYTLDDKFNFYASARFDQSNLFGVNTNQKGVPLWSAGLSWGFLQGLKGRLSYGYNGNVDKSVSAYTTAMYDNGIGSSTGLPYATIQNPPNPELRWEKVRITNIGFDFSTKNNVLSGSIDVYFKNGQDLIGVTTYPPSSGISAFRGNYANTKGKGIDINLVSQNLRSGISWRTSFIFSYAKDKVSKYLINSSGSNILDFGLSGLYPVEGRPLYSIYSYKWAGLNPENGNPRGYLNNTISEDYSKIISEAKVGDLVFNGSSRPLYFGALRNDFEYKGFNLSFNISYRLGYYFKKNSIGYSNNLGLGGDGDYYSRWQKMGDEIHTNVPSIPSTTDFMRDIFYQNSEVLIGKGDHIRLQDINFGYTFQSKKGNAPFKTIRAFVYANNLGLIWKSNKFGLDPDYLIVPPSRYYSIGLNINL